ncbi:MAG: metal-dependent hydrolase [Deltaproteobacteria bacterium]|nr:metal-dependent hydrolase [Deltaproteobacteria bacterium]
MGRAHHLDPHGAALLPDIDHITLRLMGPIAYLKYHRGFTHSIAGGIILALAFAGLVYITIKRAREMGYLRLFGLFLLGIYTHIFLDLITSYGTQLLFPFSTYRYSMNLVFILDPYLTLIFLAALILMGFNKARAKWIAITAFILMVAYLGMNLVNQRLALTKGKELARSQGIEVIRIEAYPLPLSPFRWSVIAEDEVRYYQMNLDLLMSPTSIKAFEKGPRDNGLIKKAEELEIIKTYLWFAKFPVVTLEDTKDGYILKYSDLRFNILPHRMPFLLTVVLGKDGSLKEWSLLFHTIRAN